MTIAILAPLWVLNVVYGLAGRCNRAASAALLGALILVSAGNSNNLDSANYVVTYYELAGYDLQGIEPGFIAVMRGARLLGLDYAGFRMICVVVTLASIYAAVHRLGGNTNYALACYTLYPFFFDAIQLRYSLASGIALLGIAELVAARRHNLLRFLVLILAAASLHWMTVIYLLFLAARLHRPAVLRLLAAIGVGLSFFAAAYGEGLGWIGSAASDLGGIGRRASYFETRAQLGFFLLAGFHIAMIALAHRLVRLLRPEADAPAVAREPTELSAAEHIYSFLVASLLLLPLYALNINFWRPTRGIVVALVALIGAQQLTPGTDRQRVALRVWGAFLIVALFVAQLLPIWDGAVMPFLVDNWLIDAYFAW